MKNVWIVLALCALTVGCSKTESAATDPAKPETKPTATETKPAAPKHPWSSFKVGSYVAMKTSTVMEMAGKKNTTATEMKMTLVDLSADKATLETEMTVMGQKSKTKTELPLTVTVKPSAATPAGVTPKTGTETITVAGKSMNCKWTEIEMESNGNKVTTKSWMSEEVPGFVVKSVSSTKGTANMETTTEVVDFKAA